MKISTSFNDLYTQKNITIFSIVALFTLISFGVSNAHAEESRAYKIAGDVTPVLTFRDGVETHEFPVFAMGENLVDNNGMIVAELLIIKLKH